MNKSLFDFQIFAAPETSSVTEQLHGKAGAGVLILLQSMEDGEEDSLAFLEKILDAAKLSPRTEKTALLQLGDQSRISLVELCRAQELQTVLLFGIDLPEVGIRAQLPYYHFTRIGDLHLLRAHPLHTIRDERAQNKNEKAGALWQALKTHFL